MIDEMIAYKFIDRLKKYSDLDICIVDNTGNVYMQRNDSMIATIKEISKKMLIQRKLTFETSKHLSSQTEDRMIAHLIINNNDYIGVMWIMGEYNNIKSNIEIVRMAFEQEIEFYYGKKSNINSKLGMEELITNILNYQERIAPELSEQLENLNLTPDIYRIPIVVSNDKVRPKRDMSQLKLIGDSKEDIFSCHYNECIIFKSFEVEGRDVPFRLYVEDYIKQIEKKNKSTFSWYVGPIKKKVSTYADGFRKCTWMKEFVESKKRISFFYDYVDLYLKMFIPSNEYFKIFDCLFESTGFDLDEIKSIIQKLIKHNYNYVLASKELFIHRNTLAYKFDKIKQGLNIDPINNYRDRRFLEFFYQYLEVQKKINQ